MKHEATDQFAGMGGFTEGFERAIKKYIRMTGRKLKVKMIGNSVPTETAKALTYTALLRKPVWAMR